MFMRRRPLFWLAISVLCFIGAMYFWRLGNRWALEEKAAPPKNTTNRASAAGVAAGRVAGGRTAPFHLLSEPGVLGSLPNLVSGFTNPPSRFANRLSNTTRPLGELVRSDSALLLENALLDTALPISLSIPDHLRSQSDPGTYIVQSKGPLDDAFRAQLQSLGGTIVAYVPNNAYLVQLPYASAQALAGFPQTQTVLAYEPYYKLKPALLDLAVRQKSLPDETTLNVLLFKGNEPATRHELGKLSVEVVAEQPTPFGTMLRVKPPVDTLVAIAQLPGVQEVELGRKRVHANDLSRERNGVAIDSTFPNNYLGLTGSNVLVNINDTGVDADHPDLKGRVAFDVPLSGVDSNGHGTHVAGIIAGNGSNSTSVIDAQGSIMPPSAGQFRGMAPSAKLFSMLSDLEFGPFSSDTYLQEHAARTNAFISNNSWHYFGDNEYDLAAASYDAAVRDALPGQTGSQGLLYVFAAGNAGNGNENGTGGQVDSIMSPGTAKNVLTVGAIEQLRNITNDVYKCTTIYGVSNTVTCNTNKPWQQSTDSRDQVASFSSRGNVGIGIEGDFGRFKPDVVAPGTFVVSTRSTEWDQAAYYNPTSHIFESHSFLLVPTNGLWSSPVFIPDNAVQLNISVFSDTDLPIYVLRGPGLASKTNNDFTTIDQVSTPPDGGALTPVGQNWNFSIGNPTNVPVLFDLLIDIVVTNDLGNYLDVLRSLNDQLGPYYRYESGTSMSAGSVSGTLALMQELFQERLKITNSPALMKALLINGARSAGTLYDLQVQTSLNQQGWGLINLSNSIPTDLTNKTITSSSLFYFDQSPTNALATGQKHTYKVAVNPDAQGLPMRVTVVWTDPPGNPVVSTKLVNDLDLVVTNLDNGDVFIGNDILSGNSFNLPWDTNAIANVDVINNVENVYLSPNLGTNYSVTVIGKRVNVNAVTAHTNNVAQDYAIVISCGAGELPGALTLTDTPLVTTNLANITALTNQFSASPGNSGGILQNQRTGANSPLLGTNQVVIANATPLMGPIDGTLTIGVTNQWHFYVVTNSTTFTNAAFLTFLPPTLSIPRMGVREFSIDNATRESDVDIFVSRDFNLTNLTADAVSNADKSLGRGGSETLVYSNAAPGIYYIGVKSESQEAAQYGFFGVFSELPFDSEDQFGNRTLRGINVPAVIPDGNPQVPGVVQIFAINTRPDMKVRRVVVTNILTHELMGDLIGTLTHSADRRFAVLNNHSTNRTVFNQLFVYDDSGEGSTPGAQHSDGPGSLNTFRGRQAGAQWILTELDNAPGHIGTNVDFNVWLEKQQDLTNGTTVTVLPGQCVTEFIDVFQGITNLTVFGNILSGQGPVSMTVCAESGGCKSTTLNSAPANTNQVTFDLTSNPLVNPGTYTVVLCNNGPDPVTVFLKAQTIYDLNGIVPIRFFSAGPMAIADDAVSTSSVFVTNDDRIVSVEVGVRVDHPRISDLVFHLVSPDGSRILLQENRGGNSASGIGSNLSTTNIVPVSSTGGPDAATNTVDTGQNSGTIQIDYNFFDVPDTMHIYYDGVLIFDSGQVRGAGTFNVTFGPGASTVLTIVMNEGGNPVPTTAWEYTLTAAHSEYTFFTFTENTNKTITPIKYASTPFNGDTNSGGSGQFVLPEQSLDALTGLNAFGPWQLEVWDNRVGPSLGTNGAPSLLGWELSFIFEHAVPKPIVLRPGVTQTNTVAPGQIQYFAVNVPYWANFATNWLISADGPVNVLFNQTALPTGTNAGDVQIISGNQGISTLSSNTSPILRPGLTYFLGIQNNGLATVTFAFEVDFDVTALTNGIPVTGSNASPNEPRYFYFDVTTNYTAVSFQLTNLTGNADLVVQKGLPYPTPTNYAYGSFSPGTFDEVINVFTNSDPIPLSPGRWYIGVFNANPGPVTYTIVAIGYTNAIPPIITLFNAVPYSNSNSGAAPATDYYRYSVSTNAAQVRFEILNPSADMTLVARKGLPLPSAGSYDYISANAGTTNELIIVTTNSNPVKLTPGDWFLSAINVSGGPANYTIMATELTVPWTNITIVTSGVTNGEYCITWTSQPGNAYTVQGRTNIVAPSWDDIATLTATGPYTTYCVPLPSPYQFFQVVPAGSPSVSTNAPAISNITYSPTGVVLNWTGPTTASYQVQWSSTLPPVWNTFTGTVTSTTGNFTYTDDGSQSGGLTGPRYYRLILLP
jgi:subtilisin family serine protease/subtilisin-like proprotein convertase family protein